MINNVGKKSTDDAGPKQGHNSGLKLYAFYKFEKLTLIVLHE